MLKCGRVFHTRCFRLWCHPKGRVNSSAWGDIEGNPEFYYCDFCREYACNIGAQGEGRCKELSITLTRGYTRIANKNFTKHGIITLCNLLNEEYKEVCTMTPEAISEGDSKFNFIDKDDVYKPVRLGLRYNYKWPWVNTISVTTDWENSEDLILEKIGTIYTYLNSLHLAPMFTIDELRLWEACF